MTTSIQINQENLDYAAGVAFLLLEHHHKLVMWREAYLQAIAQEDSDGQAAAAADRAVESMDMYIQTLDDTDEDADEPESVVVPGRPS